MSDELKGKDDPTPQKIEIQHNGDFYQNLMSGQEWLSRFKTELEAMQPLMSPAGYEKLKKHALAIAEKATE